MKTSLLSTLDVTYSPSWPPVYDVIRMIDDVISKTKINPTIYSVEFLSRIYIECPNALMKIQLMEVIQKRATKEEMQFLSHMITERNEITNFELKQVSITANLLAEETTSIDDLLSAYSSCTSTWQSNELKERIDNWLNFKFHELFRSYIHELDNNAETILLQLPIETRPDARNLRETYPQYHLHFERKKLQSDIYQLSNEISDLNRLKKIQKTKKKSKIREQVEAIVGIDSMQQDVDKKAESIQDIIARLNYKTNLKDEIFYKLTEIKRKLSSFKNPKPAYIPIEFQTLRETICRLVIQKLKEAQNNRKIFAERKAAERKAFFDDLINMKLQQEEEASAAQMRERNREAAELMAMSIEEEMQIKAEADKKLAEAARVRAEIKAKKATDQEARRKAEQEEAARIKAEKAAAQAAKRKAEQEEAARIKAEIKAKKAEEQEAARIKGEQRKDQEAERLRIEAEQAEKLKAYEEIESQQRLAVTSDSPPLGTTIDPDAVQYPSPTSIITPIKRREKTFEEKTANYLQAKGKERVTKLKKLLEEYPDRQIYLECLRQEIASENDIQAVNSYIKKLYANPSILNAALLQLGKSDQAADIREFDIITSAKKTISTEILQEILEYALRNNAVQILRIIVDKYAEQIKELFIEINEPSLYGNQLKIQFTPLTYAVEIRAHENIIRILLDVASKEVQSIAYAYLDDVDLIAKFFRSTESVKDNDAKKKLQWGLFSALCTFRRSDIIKQLYTPEKVASIMPDNIHCLYPLMDVIGGFEHHVITDQSEKDKAEIFIAMLMNEYGLKTSFNSRGVPFHILSELIYKARYIEPSLLVFVVKHIMDNRPSELTQPYYYSDKIVIPMTLSQFYSDNANPKTKEIAEIIFYAKWELLGREIKNYLNQFEDAELNDKNKRAITRYLFSLSNEFGLDLHLVLQKFIICGDDKPLIFKSVKEICASLYGVKPNELELLQAEANEIVQQTREQLQAEPTSEPQAGENTVASEEEAEKHRADQDISLDSLSSATSAPQLLDTPLPHLEIDRLHREAIIIAYRNEDADIFPLIKNYQEILLSQHSSLDEKIIDLLDLRVDCKEFYLAIKYTLNLAAKTEMVKFLIHTNRQEQLKTLLDIDPELVNIKIKRKYITVSGEQNTAYYSLVSYAIMLNAEKSLVEIFFEYTLERLDLLKALSFIGDLSKIREYAKYYPSEYIYAELCRHGNKEALIELNAAKFFKSNPDHTFYALHNIIYPNIDTEKMTEEQTTKAVEFLQYFLEQYKPKTTIQGKFPNPQHLLTLVVTNNGSINQKLLETVITWIAENRPEELSSKYDIMHNNKVINQTLIDFCKTCSPSMDHIKRCLVIAAVEIAKKSRGNDTVVSAALDSKHATEPNTHQKRVKNGRNEESKGRHK